MELRPYQKDACNAVVKEWNKGNKKTLLVLPTGTGKTVVFSKLAEYLVKRKEHKVLVIAHRGELLQQAGDKLRTFSGLDCALEKATSFSCGSNKPVTVASVQTLSQQKRLNQFSTDYFSTIIVDEAHHAVSDTYKRIFDYFSNAYLLGVTATPNRSDRKNLGTLFQSLAFEYSLSQAIHDGYLCPIVAQTVPLQIDISNVGISAGDFKVNELGQTLDSYLLQIADKMKEYCKGRKTVVFLPLISTSRRFCQLLNERGFHAAEINGKSCNRSKILQDFTEGKYDVLCNAMLLTEGWDCPAVDCIVCLRPTRSNSLYRQIVGRGLRPYQGKKDCLLLDFLWMIERHSLIHPSSLIAKSEEEEKRMTKKLENGQIMSLAELQEEVEQDAIKEREETLAAQLYELRKRKSVRVDPLQYELSIMDENLINYTPTFAWEKQKPSEKQLECIQKFGLSAEDVKTAGKASALIDSLMFRMRGKFSTPKQIRCLERMGFTHVGTWSFNDASQMIDVISKNKWRVPREIDAATYIPCQLKQVEQ